MVRNTPSIDLQNAEYKWDYLWAFSTKWEDRVLVRNDDQRLSYKAEEVSWVKKEIYQHTRETSIIFVSIFVSFAAFVISVLNVAWKFEILSQWIWCIFWHQICKIWRHNCWHHSYVNFKNMQKIRKLKRYFPRMQTVWWTLRGFAVSFKSIAFLCSLFRRRHRNCDAQLPGIARFHPKRFSLDMR